MAYYINPNRSGIEEVRTLGDGASMNLRWNRAYPSTRTNKIAYNIYVGRDPVDYTYPEDLFNEYPTFVVIDDNTTDRDFYEFESGGLYFFGVRAVEWDPSLIDSTYLPLDPIQNLYYSTNTRYYPKSLLAQDMTTSSLEIKIEDASAFPPTGLIIIGAEIIQYASVDYVTNTLSIASIASRGLYNSTIREHLIDGYDGLFERDPNVFLWLGPEEKNTRIFMGPASQEFTGPAFNFVDGYRERTKDTVTSDLSGSEAYNINFPKYDYSGYHRTDPNLLLSGACVGSYIGGEIGCVDGYTGVKRTVRGLNLQERINQQLEMLLESTGEPFVLIRRRRTGVYCSCMTPTNEQPDDRCPYCSGTGFIYGWAQYFYPRRSDGRILIRVSPNNEDVKLLDTGYESEFNTEFWTLNVPTIKDRDVLVRFDQDDNEEFRYEVLNVGRNMTFNRLQGLQKMQVQRVRKTDPIYQIPIFRNTSLFPAKLITSVSSTSGIPAHSHEIVINESITSASQINQVTSVSMGHSHVVRNGVIVSTSTNYSPSSPYILGHTHDIYIPI